MQQGPPILQTDEKYPNIKAVLSYFEFAEARAGWRTNLMFNVGIVSRVAFPEEPPGPADDDAQLS